MVVAGSAALAVAGCSTAPRNTGTSYTCSSGTLLKVDYVGSSALVRVDRGRTLILKSTPSNSGQAYESKSGARLHRQGNQVTWNTAARTTPETCQVVFTPL